jgi:hypothetical protein
VPLGRRAVLRWPDLSGVPAALQPVLTDRLTGNEVRMRTKTGYSFAGATRGREFTVELRATHEGALAITSLHAAPTPQGVAIDYHLSVGATTQARVRNLAGRLIRELSTDAPQAAGPSVLLWDRRSATGQLVPNGRYLIELTAHAADGQTATAIAAVTLTR